VPASLPDRALSGATWSRVSVVAPDIARPLLHVAVRAVEKVWRLLGVMAPSQILALRPAHLHAQGKGRTLRATAWTSAQGWSHFSEASADPEDRAKRCEGGLCIAVLRTGFRHLREIQEPMFLLET